MSWVHLNAGFIACCMGAVTFIAVLYALAVAYDRRHPPRRIPLQPLEPDVDPALARPISAELRQAIAERENGNG